MSTTHKIKKGLDIKLLGEAEKTVVDLNAKRFAIKPPDFTGCFPKMLVKEGDDVKAGTPLFYDKYREEIRFTSPVSGKVKEIVRGAKRKLLHVVVETDGKDEAIDFGKADISTVDRQEIIDKMLASGVWPMIRQRPYAVIANPEDEPKAIFISAFDTAPLAADLDLIVHGHGKEFQAGLDVLTKLTRIWYTGPQEVITIGKLFLEGKFDSERVVALAGSEILHPKYYKTHIGARIVNMISGNDDQW